MKCQIVVVILLSLLKSSFAQTFNINLSPSHASKLSTIKSGHQRLKKFYQFYKRDSAKHIRGQEKYYKGLLDSAYRAKMKANRIRRRLARKGIVVPDSRLALADSLDNQLKRWYVVMKDTTASDSVRKEATRQVKALALQKAKRYPGFQYVMERYHLGDSVDWKSLTTQVPELDTISNLFDSSPAELFEVAERQFVQQFAGFTGADAIPTEFGEAQKLAELPEDYKKHYEQYTDKVAIRQKAVEEAVNYFSKYADKLRVQQSKVSKLMSKYRDIPNSSDLRSAIKRTSMKGKTFWEHLVIGGTFNVLSTDPVSLDLAPSLGYKFTTRFAVGVGMNYRQTFSDSIRHRWYVSPVNIAFKAFGSYEVTRGFFAYSEWERSGVAKNSQDKTLVQRNSNFFIGAGKKVPIHPKMYITTILLYNLNPEDENSVYPQRFQLRIGFQLSELATRKEKAEYNPNRY